jgi:hypothetical protein
MNTSSIRFPFNNFKYLRSIPKDLCPGWLSISLPKTTIRAAMWLPDFKPGLFPLHSPLLRVVVSAPAA